jgi:tripartite-type tricarboxylate transporter receptor subunit TctC
MGVEAVGSTPEQLTAAMKAEVARFTKVVKDAGIRGGGA